MTRCYNCGLSHLTQNCPSYGPKYPAPGKTSQDYGKEAQRIANLFARDIIREHEAGHVDEGEVLAPASPSVRPKLVSEYEANQRQFFCGHCGAVPSSPCRTTAGKACSAHSHRTRQYLASLQQVVDV